MNEAFRDLGTRIDKEGEAIQIGDIVLQPFKEIQIMETDNETFDFIAGRSSVRKEDSDTEFPDDDLKQLDQLGLGD